MFITGCSKIDLPAAANFLRSRISQTDITVVTQQKLLWTIKHWSNESSGDISSSGEDSGKSSPDDDNSLDTLAKTDLADKVYNAILSLSACNASQQCERLNSVFFAAGCTPKDVRKFKL
ncbi:hypothetical protein HA402_014077 [Bradysia odoriphaga]|nr:hypothetical protein HA402_014077 [Bradysia odoriphaga]